MHECSGCDQCKRRDQENLNRIKNAPSLLSLKLKKIKTLFNKKKYYVIAKVNKDIYIYLNKKVINVCIDDNDLDKAMSYVRRDAGDKKFQLKVIQG